MKILMINVVCGIRSTGRICTDMAAALEAQGYEVKIAYGREEVPEQFQKYAVRIGSDLDVKLHGVKARLYDGCGFGSRRATKKFIQWVIKYDPDVIHLHNIHGYYINVEILFNYLRTCGKKIIWTLHDCWSFTGHTAYCDAVGCEKWKNGCGSCPQMKEYPKSIIDRSKQNWKKKKKLFTNVNNMTIVTPSQWLADLVKESFLKQYSIRVIHNGINTSQFRPLLNDFKEYYGIQGKTMLLGIATAWNENIGFSDYIKLADILGHQYQVVLVGLTDEQKKNLPMNVLGITQTNSVKELAHIYSAADFYINLSNTESYSMTNIEAMCCGTPVITYDVGGSKESAELSKRIVVEKGNLDAMVKAITNFELDCEIDINTIDNKKTVEDYIQIKQTEEGYWGTKDSFGLIGKIVILGVAAVWDARKGLHDLLHAIELLPEEYKLIVVGLTEKQKTELPDSIIGITHTNSKKELANLYSVADVFVNPTYEDNYPTTNLEAIACGTPVVTYETGGSPESAKMYGISVPKKDIEKLVRTIENTVNMKLDGIDIDNRNTVFNYIELYEE